MSVESVIYFGRLIATGVAVVSGGDRDNPSTAPILPLNENGIVYYDPSLEMRYSERAQQQQGGSCTWADMNENARAWYEGGREQSPENVEANLKKGMGGFYYSGNFAKICGKQSVVMDVFEQTRPTDGSGGARPPQGLQQIPAQPPESQPVESQPVQPVEAPPVPATQPAGQSQSETTAPQVPIEPTRALGQGLQPFNSEDMPDYLPSSGSGRFQSNKLVPLAIGGVSFLAMGYAIYNILSDPNSDLNPIPKKEKKPKRNRPPRQAVVVVDKRDNTSRRIIPDGRGLPGHMVRTIDPHEIAAGTDDEYLRDDPNDASYSDWSRRHQIVVDANVGTGNEDKVQGSYIRDLLNRRDKAYIIAKSRAESDLDMIEFHYRLARKSGLPVDDKVIDSLLKSAEENTYIYANWGKRVKRGDAGDLLLGVRAERKRRNRNKPPGMDLE